MSDAALNVIVGADVSKAVAGFKQGASAAGDFGNAVTNSSNAASKAINDVEDSIGSLQQQLKGLKSLQLSIIDPKELADVNAAIATTESGIERLKSVGKQGFDEFGEAIQDTDKKSVAFLGTLGRQKIAFLDLGRVVTGQGFSLQALSRNFTLFNPLLIIAAAGIGLLAKALYDAAQKEKEAQKALEDYQRTFGKAPAADTNTNEVTAQLTAYKKAVDDAVSTTGKEASQVDVLVARLQAGNTSRLQTVDIIKKLQQIAPDYFSKLNAEKASVDDVTKAYNAYNNSLTQSLETQIKIDEINEIVKNRLASQQLNPAASKFINDQLSAGKSLDEIQQQISKDFDNQQKQLIQLGQANKFISDEMQKQILLQGKVPAGSQVILAYLQQEKTILDSIKNANLKDIGVTVKPTDSLAAEKSQLEQIVKLQEELNKNSNQPLFERTRLSLNLQDQNSAQFKLLQDNIAEALIKGQEIGTKASAENATTIANLYKQILQKQIGDVGIHINFTLQNPGGEGTVEEAEKKVQEQLAKFDIKEIKVKVPISLINDVKDDTGLTSSEKEVILRKIEEDATKNIPDVKLNIPLRLQFKADLDLAQLEKIDAQLTKTVQGIASNAIETFSQAIGDAFAGKKDPFQAVVEFLGDALESFGKDLIATSKIIEGIKVALGSIFENPFAALAVGVAAIALGAFLKSEAHKSSGGAGFATGGFVDGPGTTTSDSIPARLSKGEYVVKASSVAQPGIKALLDGINSGQHFAAGGFVGGFDNAVSFPLQQLNAKSSNIQSASTMINIAGDFRLKGPDLLLSISRATKLQSYVG